jgi:hypothetical protein|tara:strand:- start:8567 stop:8767 length:201 start_codon:yes stop_codon:yes gene_type:complete
MSETYHFLEHVKKIIASKRSQVLDILSSDGVKNMEHYKELMGNLSALEYIEQELKSLLNKQEQMDE